MGWLLLGGFLVYWFLLKQGSAGSLVNEIRNELSMFSQVPAAGGGLGTITNPGSHTSAPGIMATPIGQPNSYGPSMLPLGEANMPVYANTPLTGGIPVGVVGPLNQPASGPTIRPIGLINGSPAYGASGGAAGSTLIVGGSLPAGWSPADYARYVMSKGRMTPQ
jgi:hypothetical protein